MSERRPKYDFYDVTPLRQGNLACSDAHCNTSPRNYEADVESSKESTTPISSAKRRCRPTRESNDFNQPSTSSRITPKSSRTPNVTGSSSARNNNRAYIVSVVEGRGMAKGEVGMACLDLKNPELILCQFPDTQLYTKVIAKLEVYDPLEIIMPVTSNENQSGNQLLENICQACPNTNVTRVLRKYFNEVTGIQNIRHLCAPEYSSVELEISAKYYCLAAAAALLKYIEFIQNIIYAPKSMKVVFMGSESTAMIDIMTSRHLELISNLQDMTSNHSLYGTLHYTKTAGGSRILRADILQPLTDIDTINARLDCVSELVENQELLHNLQAILSRFLDTEHIISNLVQIQKLEELKAAEQKITNILYLRHTLELVEPLCTILEESQNPLVKAIQETLKHEAFNTMLESILHVIHDDTRYMKGTLNMRTMRCFAIKPFINGLLDVARKMYSEVIDDIYEGVSELAETCHLPLQTAYNATRGFFIQMPRQPHVQLKDLPPTFINISASKNTLSFTTQKMLNLNSRANTALNEIYLMSNTIVTGLLDSIRHHIGHLYKLAEGVSFLDMLVAFAHAATLFNFVRPEFADTTAIMNGMHPILRATSNKSVVPNDTFLSTDSNVLIITGPNMSGKTTYLKQVAVLQIMAQIGSFVPAERACFRITNQIFSCLGSDDNIETNSSTFMREMKETAYILHNLTDSSLIIIDEIARSTSPDIGAGLCYAICERLADCGAFSIITTHFNLLTKLETRYSNVSNQHFHVEVVQKNDKHPEKVEYNYVHILKSGPCTEKDYGLKLAETFAWPGHIMKDAHTLAQKIKHQEYVDDDKTECLDRLKEKLASEIMRLSDFVDTSDPEELRKRLKELKLQYEKDVARVKEE